MSLDIDTVAENCNKLAKEVRDRYKNLTTYFVVYHDGQLTETAGLAINELSSHPASEAALHIIKDCGYSQESRYLGTAAARHTFFMGLATRDVLLSLCTANLEEFENLKEFRRYAWHAVWHAIDASDFYDNPANRQGLKSKVIARKHTAFTLLKANLQADIFSALMCHEDRDLGAIDEIAKIRALHTLLPASRRKPEFFAFPLATDALHYTIKHARVRQFKTRSKIDHNLRIAQEISETFDKKAFKNWLIFAKSAQDMAWRGFKAAEILSAAINTSENIPIRSIGHLISETTAITPVSARDIREQYSTFADKEFNQALHEKTVNQVYEETLAEGLQENSPAPFIKLADRQNRDLTEGRVLGWCASSLQDAANVYRKAVESGQEPGPLVRKRLESRRSDVPWENLQQLGEKIVERQRDGHMVTLCQLEQLCEEIKGIKDLQESIRTTMASPYYIEQLEAIQELAAMPDAPAPKGPAPKAATPAPAAAPTGPGLGGSPRRPVQQAPQQPEKEGQKEPATTDETITEKE